MTRKGQFVITIALVYVLNVLKLSEDYLVNQLNVFLFGNINLLSKFIFSRYKKVIFSHFSPSWRNGKLSPNHFSNYHKF